jgi:hypothetical protein
MTLTTHQSASSGTASSANRWTASSVSRVDVMARLMSPSIIRCRPATSASAAARAASSAATSRAATAAARSSSARRRSVTSSKVTTSPAPVRNASTWNQIPIGSYRASKLAGRPVAATRR